MALNFFSLLITIGLFQISSAQAQEGLVYLIRQPATMAMGGAGVGLADDEYALFQNPAGLAGQEISKWTILDVALEGSTDVYKAFGTSFNAVKNFNTNSLNALMGYDLHFRADAMTLFQLPHFSIAYLADAQGAIDQFNQANPTFKLGDMITHGIQFGTGIAFSGGRHPTGEFRVGVAGKVLWRRGGYYNVSTAGFLAASNDSKGYVDSLVGTYGIGFGADLGIQYVKHFDKQTDFSVGASVLDIGDTGFADTHAEKIPMNVGIGLGFKKDLHFFKVKVGADLRNLTQTVVFVNKTHLGTQISIPILDFYAGLNQMNLTYGVGFDIWLIKFLVTSYTDELGIGYHQNPSGRYMAQVSLSLPI